MRKEDVGHNRGRGIAQSLQRFQQQIYPRKISYDHNYKMAVNNNEYCEKKQLERLKKYFDDKYPKKEETDVNKGPEIDPRYNPLVKKGRVYSNLNSIIHFDYDGKYLCNQNINAHNIKLTEDESKVTCKNCLAILARDILNKKEK